MELLLEGSEKAIKEAAAKGMLTWKGKKVILDPFLPVGYLYEIASAEEGFFHLTPFLTLGTREEPIASCDLVCTLGALQGGTFRLWKDRDYFEKHPPRVSSKELEVLIKEGLPHRFKGEKPRLKPAPLPILKLTDRTGGFADLYLDYGSWGEVAFHDHPPTAEEYHWESDLLETAFKKKIMPSSHYFCPLDQVAKSIVFLIEMGWKVVDHRGKKIIRQEALDLQTEEAADAILLRGSARFGEKSLPIQDVVGAFERHERWIDLSPNEVGLIELPPSWDDLSHEEKTPDGIRVRKTHLGLLEQVASLPPSYQKTTWEETPPGPAFQGTLFPYQQKGVSWLSFLYRAGFSGLLADEMGLGKTVQVLAFLTQIQGRILIVMPVSLLSLWKEQFHRFCPSLPVYMHQGPTRSESLAEFPIILTSYATLRADINLFSQLSFDTIILDEAQMIKNGSTQIAQALYRLKSRFRLALTGTPVENRIEEVVSIFRFLMPGLLGDGAFNELSRKKIKPFLLRRTKQEVGLDLPEKIIQKIGVDPSEEEFSLYETLLRTKRKHLQDLTRMEVLELILRLRQQACHPQLLDPSYTGESCKFNQVLADLEEVISSGHKVLLYSQFTSVLKLFETALQAKNWNYAYLDGSTRDRAAPVEQFQNDPSVPIFLISLKAGGVGLNLQAADYVFLYDPWWNAAVEAQAIDRAHRVGRKKTVIARKYFTSNTIEAKIFALQEKKQALAEGLFEDRAVLEALSFEEIAALLES